MADKIVLSDTSILIDLFRKTDKANSALISLVRQGYIYCISSITEYEIYTGTTPGQVGFWDDFLDKTSVLSFDKTVARVAATLNQSLKRRRTIIDLADLFIAATAVANNLPLATLNRKHFERVDGLSIIE